MGELIFMQTTEKLVGKRLAKFRKEANYRTRADLALVLKEKENTLGRWERGERTLPYDTLVLICTVLGITPNDVFPGPWNNPPKPESEPESRSAQAPAQRRRKIRSES